MCIRGEFTPFFIPSTIECFHEQANSISELEVKNVFRKTDLNVVLCSAQSNTSLM